MTRFRLYLDESGDHTYNLINEPAHRFLCLLGVWFHQNDYVIFADELERFKRSIFGPRPDKPVILHRSDIINCKGPFGVLCNRDLRTRFDNGLLEVIKRAKFKIVSVVIDKLKHQNNYSDPFHPYHFCMAAILDRYSGWLNYKNAVGDVMAESRGKEEDLQLKEAYHRVYSSGTLCRSHKDHQKALTSKDIKIQPKQANIAGLQLADMLAYPIKQITLIQNGEVADRGDVFGKKVMEVVKDKFNRNERTEKIDGYGKIRL